MTIDSHSVVYFINEEYGVVLRANGRTREIASWDRAKGCFAKRLDLLTASFLVRTDRFEGKWCAAHATYSVVRATAAARSMSPNLPNQDGMALARTAKERDLKARLHASGTDAMLAEILETWRKRDAKYAEM